MTEKQIEIILQQGENSKIEFKKRINKELASEICAFSNSQGGVILNIYLSILHIIFS